MLQPLRLLIVDDSPDDAGLMVRELKRAGFAPESVRVEREQEFVDRLEEGFHIALIDFSLPHFDGLTAVSLVRRHAPEMPCVVVSGSIGDAMAVECLRRGAFDYVLKDRLQRLVPAVQNALETARLQAAKRQTEIELKKTLERLNLIARVTGVVVGAKSLMEQAEELTEQVRCAFEADACVALRLEDGELPLLACSGAVRRKFPKRLPADTGIAHAILSRQQPLCVLDAKDDPLFGGETNGHSADAGHLSFAGAPMLIDERAVGILGVFSRNERRFDDSDLDHLQVAANHLAVAVTNDRLYKRFERQQKALELEVTERKHAEQLSAAFARLGTQLSAATNLEEAAEIVAQTAQELLGWDSFSALLVDPEGELLERILSFDLIEGRRQKLPAPPGQRRAGELTRRAAKEGPQLILRGKDPKFSPDLGPFGDVTRPSASLMFVPMAMKGGLAGVLTIQSYRANAYTPEDLETLTALAEHCTGAFDRIHSQQELQNIFEYALDGICRSSLDGRILSANPAMAGLLGHESARVLMTEVTDLRTGVFARPEEYDRYVRLLETENAARMFEAEFRRKDGRHIWVSINGRADRNVEGRLICFESIIEDVSARRKSEEMLRRTEELYRLAIRAAGAVPYSFDFQSSKYGFLDERVKEMTGYPAGEMDGRLWDQITLESHMRGEAAGLSRERAAEQARAGRIGHWLCDSLIRTRQGGLKWITDSAVQQLNDAGEPVGTVGILQDITELKLAVETLRATEQTYRRAIAAVGAVPYCYDIGADRYAFIGEGITELTGCRLDEMTPEVWEELIESAVVHGEGAGLTWREAIHLHQTGGIRNWKCDVRIRRPDGRTRWISDGAVPLLNERNEVTGFVGVLQDITERKEAEQKIREQAGLLDLASDAICLTNMNQDVVFWNRGAERIYGWTAPDAIGRNVTDMLFKGDNAKPAEVIKSLIRNQQWAGEVRQFKRSGEEIVVESRWTLVRNDHAQPRGILIIGSDITEKKKLESQFLRAQRLESIGTLASGIAHDLNNVLAPILMSIGLLESCMKTNEERSILSSVETSAKRGAEIVKHLLTFARGIGGERILIQPKHLISELAKILRGTIPKDITIRTLAPDELWVVSGNATHLQQVLLNLCVNARDAMPQGGTLRVVAGNVELDEHYAGMSPDAKPGAYVRIDVADSGTGIAPEHLDKIFDPFFTTKEPGMGTGLGLSSTLGIVKSHDGFVTVQSKVNEGTTFSIFLPARPLEKDQMLDAQPVPWDRGRGELVLVADDEVSIRKIMRRTLESRGYRTLIAEDGAQALALYVQHQDEIALVITDLAMPFMDGLALARAIRKMHPDRKIMVSTGHGQSERMAELKDLGLVTFLSKPYTADRLLFAIKEELQTG